MFSSLKSKLMSSPAADDFVFRCANISWFQVVTKSVSHLFPVLRLAHLRVFQIIYICLQWKGFKLILEMSILFCHLHKIGAQFPCRQHLRALIYSNSTSILHNKPLLCEGSSVSHTIIQIYTAVGIIKIIKMRGRHCAQCLVNYHRFYHQKSLWEPLDSNRPSLSGFATGMANFTFDVHLGMIVIFDNLETEWIVIYMKIW